jgi:ribosomal protein S18 acetylase RimI-like enzyme
LRAGKIYRTFKAKNGRNVVLRSLRWEDLDDCVRFINSLVEERGVQSDLGIIADKKQTREEESEWLANLLVGVEKGDILSVAAEADGRIVANSEVTRGRYGDTRHHGYVGISVLKNHRGLGVGYEMMKTLMRESRRAGLKSLQLEVFANNARAIHVYEKAGFRQAGRIPRKIHRGSLYFDIILMTAEL